MSMLNTISIINQSGLDPSKYTIWVAGYLTKTSGEILFLRADGTFAAPTGTSGNPPFIRISEWIGKDPAIQVPDVASTGNNRLVFTVVPAGTEPGDYPISGYTAYPFPGTPGVCPPGPYDIFEFGPNAQYDVSAVDSFGLNLSFTVSGLQLVFGAQQAINRRYFGPAFQSFTANDPCGAGFGQLLYTAPSGAGYPAVIEGQFSAIVSPKDWLAIYPEASGLNGYWTATVDAFFTSGNQFDLYLNGATVGSYKGKCENGQYTLKGPGDLDIVIPKSDFAGNQPFIQAVRGKRTNETEKEYEAFAQIEAAMFEAFSRGVALDGVMASGTPIPSEYTSKAWLDTANWFSHEPNSYNGQPRIYDVYAKFFHYSDVKGNVGTDTLFCKNASGSFAMAYGFSLDENPNVGHSWSTSDNVPSKTPGTVGSGAVVAIIIGPW